ncbi:2-aminomuconic semialdehyde dehydrogenase [Procambarus clarkii]|uniref:2-aminomuconic semialdehyde dehydrogenase n=1 Tax=Procambarus clarkii TaxID=6728 RepID=UPI00374328F3
MEVVVVVENFLAGTMVPCRRLVDSYEPGTGVVWAKVPESGKLEVDAAVAAAKRALPKWSRTTAQERAKYLLKVADLLEAEMEAFAVAESRDQGKPLWLARTVDVPRAIFDLRHAAHALQHLLATSSVQSEADVVSYVLREPVGVVGIICPWNKPLCGLTGKLAPALMCGNTVVAKPSQHTSVTSYMLCKLIQDAGLPAGTVNMVFGSGPVAGEALAAHNEVSLLAFTGSTKLGKHIACIAASLLKRFSLETGGNNAAVVFKDCDLNLCIDTLKRSSFLNQGETRLCTTRIYVEETLYEEFLDSFVEAVRELRVGPPSDENVFMGAMVSKDNLETVRGFVNLALEEGGAVLCGDDIESCSLPTENKNGFFMRPTVISGLQDESRCMQAEIRGPVVCVLPFHSEQEVVRRINSSDSGVGACVWTSSLGVAHRVARKLKAETVCTNCWSSSEQNCALRGGQGRRQGRPWHPEASPALHTNQDHHYPRPAEG